MSKAQGEYFIFVDSDCMFPPQWLAEIEKAQNEHYYDAFGGPDTCHPSFSPLLKAINYSMTSFIGTGGTRGNKKHVGRFSPEVSTWEYPEKYTTRLETWEDYVMVRIWIIPCEYTMPVLKWG